VGHRRAYKVIRGPHYDADATVVVPELARNIVYILFLVKGIVNYRKIISRRLYVPTNRFLPSKELVHLLTDHFETLANKINNVNISHSIHFHTRFRYNTLPTSQNSPIDF